MRTSERLHAYASLVRAHADRTDLVAPDDLARFEDRHVADSLRLAPVVASLGPGPCADVGSGAGLPGIPLAIADPLRTWRLIEPRRRRAAFLEEAVRSLGLANCEVIVATAEQARARNDLAAVHVCAVARALAPPETALGLLTPLVAPGGIAALFIGSGGRPPRGSEEVEPGLAIVRVDPEEP